MCRQDSRVHLSAEEELAAEESLSIYCKPVELYNILQRRAVGNVMHLIGNISICFLHLYFCMFCFFFFLAKLCGVLAVYLLGSLIWLGIIIFLNH